MTKRETQARPRPDARRPGPPGSPATGHELRAAPPPSRPGRRQTVDRPAAGRRRVRGLLAVVLVVLMVACGGSEEPIAEPPAPQAPVAVQTALAMERTVPESIEVTGAIEPWRRVSPGTKILGRIDEVPAREGERVDAGQVLARLENRDLAAAVEQARAAVSMAEATLENATAQHRRMEQLHAERSVTDKSLEDAVARFRVAQAGLRVAEADLAAAEVMLTYAEITTPLAGWVAERRVERGDMAAPGAPLFVIEDLSRVKVRVDVPESAVVDLERGDAATVYVDVVGAPFEASIDRILPAGDRASRTFQVELVLDNEGGRLRSGMYVRARFPRDERTVLTVPATALVARGELDGLFVVGDDGRARLRWVKLGRALEGEREVLSGLETGERYVVDPPSRLTDGAAVTTG